MATSTKLTATTKAAALAESKPQVQVAAPSRREFLFYIWGASMVLLLGEATAGLIWFALPRFKEGEFGGIFKFSPEDLPQNPGGDPVSVPSGRFHLSYTADSGLIALYGVCTHLGCLPIWNPGTTRFECPCHGSKYELNGKYIEGPAPRSLDAFSMVITFNDGTTLATAEDGLPIQLGTRRLDEIASVDIDTGNRIQRPSDIPS